MKLLTDNITKNILSTLELALDKVHSKSQHQVASLKTNCALFSRLYMSCHSSSGNHAAEVFAHKHHACPPLILKNCDTAQSKILCDTYNQQHQTKYFLIVTRMWMLKFCSAILHMLPSKGVRTNSNDYAVYLRLPYIRRYLQNVNRLDVV